MSAVDRRTALKIAAGAGVAAASASLELPALGAVKAVPSSALGMLYDTTLCIGCKACVTACYEANDLAPDTARSEREYGKPLHYMPDGLSEHSKNVIKLYKDETSPVTSFVKRQCMHCVEPACCAACMMHALTKDPETGVVSWAGEACVGCRYCQIACPYNVVTFEWTALNPRIVKCELCRHRFPEAKGPACCEVCPRGAVIYGTREELLAEAKRRLAENPKKYVPKIYGEVDGGGTQVLYLSHVPFEKLGLPELTEESLPEYTHSVQGTLYKGFAGPLVLFGALAFAMRERRLEAVESAQANGKGLGPGPSADQPVRPVRREEDER